MFAILAILVAGPVGFVGPMAPASAQCGADETTAVRSALDQLPPERVTGRSWASAPLESNYDSCADLSTVLVMIEGGTREFADPGSDVSPRDISWHRHLEGLRIHVSRRKRVQP